MSYFKFFIWSFIIGLVAGFFSCNVGKHQIVDMSTFHIQEGFTLELIAAEPLVMDPVAMEIDEHGKMYVVEMPGYPTDVTGSGRVKVLKDNDGDNIIDESILFAEGLTLPTGIMRWKSGVIITDAPDVIYLEDTDGDDVADKREVLLTGFSLSNPQHNMNTPKYGLDNWIYLGHEGAFITKAFVEEFGDEGSEIVFPGIPDSPTLPPNANERSVRFQPDQSLLETLSGKTQFGYTFDNWGHLFNSSNAMHLWHEVIAARYINSGNLGASSIMDYLPADGPGIEVFPTTRNPEHQLLTDIGVITSACGLTWYQGGAFPPEYDRVCFSAEPVHNLVYAELVEPDGASFRSQRMFERTEFLSSEDSWFRPVNFYIGPSGDLFLIDYYRQYIEHPEWMAEDVVQSGALYNGQNKGRIYRIRPLDAEPDEQSISSVDGTDLIPFLAHPNIWHRRNAQRMLLDEPMSEELVDSLIEFALSTTSSVGLVHAMWTIEGFASFSEDVIRKGLSHGNPGVRENSIQIAELHWEENRNLLPQIFALQKDPDPRVRFQLLCTSALIHDPAAKRVFEKLLLSDISDEWIQRAALASSGEQIMDLIQFVISAAADDQFHQAGPFIVKAAEMVSREGQAEKVKELISLASKNGRSGNEWWRSAVFEGLASGLRPGTAEKIPQLQVNSLLNFFDVNVDPDLRRSAMHLLATTVTKNSIPPAQLKLALLAIEESAASPELAIDAITILEIEGISAYISQLESLLDPSQPVEVQERAVSALHTAGASWFGEFIFGRWQHLTPSIQKQAMSMFIISADGMRVILSAIRDGTIHRSNIPWNYTSRLMNNSHPEIRQEARSLLAGDELPREELFEKYRPALEGTGDLTNGKAMYELVCSTCHQIAGDDGLDFGPDLAPIRNRSKVAILNDLLFPNLAIADGYGTWEINLENHQEPVIGVISEELNEAIVVKDATGKETIISRSEIASLKPLSVSAMPAGLENQITVEQMRDLIEYIKRPYL